MEFDFTVEILLVYIIPFYHLFGSLVNFLNAIVFSCSSSSLAALNRAASFKCTIYEYLRIYSLINALLIFITVGKPLMVCDQKFRYSNTYAFNVYQLYVVQYASTVLSILRTLVKVKIALSRLNQLRRNTSNTNSNVIAVIFLAIPAVYYIPTLFYNEITEYTETSNSTKLYKIQLSKLGSEHSFFQLGLFFSQYLIIITSIVLMVTLTVVIYKSIRKKYENHAEMVVLKVKKRNRRNSYSYKSKSLEDRITRMVVLILIIFIIEQVVTAIGNTIYLFLIKGSFTAKIFLLSMSIVFITCTILNTVIYYKFNKTFARKFKKLVLCSCLNNKEIVK